MRHVRALLVVLLVAAAPVGVYLAPSSHEGPSHPDAWDTRVQDLVTFVEQERGLTFAHPVHIRFLDGKAFDEKVAVPAAEKKEAREEAERYLATARALGLASGNPDLLDALDRLGRTQVLGVYDPVAEELYVDGTELTPGVRAVVVHELTHALQDQHFDLEALEENAPRGAEIAVEALVEGDAERIRERYVAQLSDSDRRRHDEEAAEARPDADEPEVPDVLEHLFAFPYVFGPVLLDSLVAAGGNATVDQAFEHPPVAEAQVLDPQRYPLSFVPAAVADPQLPEGAEKKGEAGAFGQFVLYDVIGARLGHAKAWAAVQGWAGDRYQDFELDGRSCVAVTTRMRDDAAARRLTEALQEWSLGTEAAILRESTDVQVRACDPGAEQVRPARQPAAFDVLALRAALVHLGAQQGLEVAKAVCVVDAVLADLPARTLAQLIGESLGADEQRQVLGAFQLAQQRCVSR